ncbi:hypothetical protein [Sphingobacterium sp. NPDC055431]
MQELYAMLNQDALRIAQGRDGRMGQDRGLEPGCPSHSLGNGMGGWAKIGVLNQDALRIA